MNVTILEMNDFIKQLPEVATQYGFSVTVGKQYYGYSATICDSADCFEDSNSRHIAPVMPMDRLYNLFIDKACDWNAFFSFLRKEEYTRTDDKNNFADIIIGRLKQGMYLDKMYPCFVRDTQIAKEDYITGSFCGLLYMYRVLICGQEGLPDCSIPVTDNLASLLGLTAEKINEIAFANLKAVDEKNAVWSMNDLFALLMNDEDCSKTDCMTIEQFVDECCLHCDEDDAPPMYVISNRSKNFGANSLFSLFPYLKKIADNTGRDKLYIIPSSIHELLFVFPPVTSTESEVVEQLTSMIMDVNENEVEAKEQLADVPLVYDRDTDTLYLAYLSE